MAPAVEILFTEAKGVYHNDPLLLNPVLDIVGASEGSLGIYHGVSIEDPSILLIVIIWDKLEDHHALMDDKERYTKLIEAFSKVADIDKMNLFHVYFDIDLVPVLNAPFTSFGHVVALKPGKTAEDLQAALKALASPIQIEGCYGGSYAKAVEKDEWVILHGWDDPKFHLAQIKQTQTQILLKAVSDVIDDTKEGTKRGHVKLITYKKYQP